MDLQFERSRALARDVVGEINHPLYDSSPRIEISDLLCSLAMEHAYSARLLLQDQMLPSALVIHRAQFEAVVRSIWTLYAASGNHLSKLAAQLTVDTEQAAKNLPSTHDMMSELARKAPAAAFAPLDEFKTHNWKALNSYTHAGIHPISRHRDGYPQELVLGALLNVNGLLVVAAMQAAILTGVPDLQKRVLAAASAYQDVLRPIATMPTARS